MRKIEISKLNDSSLLSILLTSERARYLTVESSDFILKCCQNSLYGLISISANDLVRLPGLHLADINRLKASHELFRRYQVAELMKRTKISKSSDAFEIFRHLSDLPYEEFWIITLNRGNRVIDQFKVSEGGVSGTVVDPKRVYNHALKVLASAIILVHNHPSGNLSPSDADKLITETLVNGGKLLDISVLDHIIVGNHEFSSFADNGLM